MSSLSDIRDGLVTRFQTISGLNSGTQVQGTLADRVPFAEVGWPTRIDYLSSEGSGAEFTIAVRLYVGLASNTQANEDLEKFLDTTGSLSMAVAVDGDRTLGGKASSAVVTAMTGAGRADVGNNVFLVADFEVDVLA